MRRLLSAALALLALAGCGPKPQAANDADPALWVVKDADTTIYLFGTVHMLKPGLSWFDEGVKAAFEKSDALMLEVVLPGDAEMAALVAELGDASGPPLSGQLAPAQAAEMRAALAGLGMAPDALDRKDPWLAATLLASLPLQRLGYDPRNGAEAVLTDAARKAGKPINGFETAREQLGYFDALSLPAQRALLDQTIRALPQADKTLDQAVTAWSEGDAGKLAALVNDDVASSPEVADALLFKRNRRWADWIAKRMAQPGTVFVAVGAGHLAGAGDVQAELAKRGLKVERVAY